MSLSACVHPTLPPYPVRAAAEYATAQLRGDLVVAVEPVIDAALSEKTLGSDLVADEQVLAILVVVENRSRSRSYLARAEDVALLDADAAALPADMGNPLGSGVGTASHVALSVGVAVFPPLALAFLPASMATGESVAGSRATHHVLVRSAWNGHTISPGERESGLVYVPLDAIDPSLRAVGLHVTIRHLGSGADERFEFEIPLPEIERKG